MWNWWSQVFPASLALCYSALQCINSDKAEVAWSYAKGALSIWGQPGCNVTPISLLKDLENSRSSQDLQMNIEKWGSKYRSHWLLHLSLSLPNSWLSASGGAPVFVFKRCYFLMLSMLLGRSCIGFSGLMPLSFDAFNCFPFFERKS